MIWVKGLFIIGILQFIEAYHYENWQWPKTENVIQYPETKTMPNIL